MELEIYMSRTLIVQEMAIIIATQPHNPSVLTPDFLKYSGIVPTDWKIARQPIQSTSASQVTFLNGVNIVAQPNRIAFSEIIAAKDLAEVSIPNISHKYMSVLPQVDYQTVGINFVGYTPFEETQQTARDYIFASFLAPGAWQEIDETPAQAALQLSYALKNVQLNLSINQVKFRSSSQQEVTAVAFSANFNYPVTKDRANGSIDALSHIVENWQNDLQTYKDIINTRFLQQLNGSSPELKTQLSQEETSHIQDLSAALNKAFEN
jgi:hypothetical protein